MALVNAGGTGDSSVAAPPERPDHPATSTKAKNQNIRVSPAVLDAALKDGDALLQSLGTRTGGLTQAEAEERARTTGPNEVAQERRQGWFVRLLKIIRNPLHPCTTDPSEVSAPSEMAIPNAGRT
jgi:magnesium-transporting ATPase (P-type)